MDAPDPWPVVSLKGDPDVIDKRLGEAMERCGQVCLSDHGLPPALLSTCKPLCMVAQIVIEHLERYLGEHRIDLSASMQSPKKLFLIGDWAPMAQLSGGRGRWDHLLAIFVRPDRPETILVQAGDMLEEWSRGQIRSVPERAIEGVKTALYLRPSPDTILRLMPRFTVELYLEGRARTSDAPLS